MMDNVEVLEEFLKTLVDRRHVARAALIGAIVI